MKAVLLQSYGGPEKMYIGEWPRPVPAPNEILVKVSATALNRADTLQRMGKYPPPEGASPILGLEMAGAVVETGPEVQRWKSGDRVCGLLEGGGYAGYAVLHEEMALPIPGTMSYEEAAAIPEVFLTAFQALNWLAGLGKGEKVLIHAGASGVGTAAIQLARQISGAEVWVTASASKHDLCLGLGAAAAIDYKKQAFDEMVKEWTGGAGVDVIIDFIGAPYFQKNINSLSRDGRLVLLALMGGVHVDRVNIAPFLQKRIQVMGSTLRSRPLDYKIRLTKALREFAWQDFENKAIVPVIDTIFDWEEVAEAHRYMEANLNKGKIVLRLP